MVWASLPALTSALRGYLHGSTRLILQSSDQLRNESIFLGFNREKQEKFTFLLNHDVSKMRP
ncbi:hypothetical protein A3715_16520 [Oleiphilus sp. HI0009]|nr:hypothetical protein A3715_16520 [Oleiphilus sp. HI0009]KZY70022.1 hypothetical protein A3738_04015 [Oleiphilus sp. HI0066]KZY72015.1 hypothetical protein A3739_16180 [Oleiphilus sp. HI0067]